MEIKGIRYEQSERTYGHGYHYVIRNGGDAGFRQEWYEENSVMDAPDHIRLKPENGLLTKEFEKATHYSYYNDAKEIRDKLEWLMGGMWTIDKVWDSGTVISVYPQQSRLEERWGPCFMYEVPKTAA